MQTILSQSDINRIFSWCSYRTF